MAVPTRLVSVVFDASDIRSQARFWSDALGWRFAEEYLEHDEAVLQADDGSGLEVIFVPVEGAKTSKNRVHLDLAAPSEDEARRFVQFLLARGAHHVDIGQGDVAWTVLADPEGNEFCVTAAPGATGRLGAICFDAADPVSQAGFWT